MGTDQAVGTDLSSAYAETKAQISAFVIPTFIVQSIYFLNPKFQASSHLLWLYSPGQNSRRQVFS